MTLPAHVAPWAAVLPSQTLGDYLIGPYLGHGNFSLVFEATHVRTKSSFAIKVLLPLGRGEDEIDFAYEGQLLARLNKCSGVITLVETGSDHLFFTLMPGAPPAPVKIDFHVLSRASGSLEELIEDPTLLARLTWEERLAIWRNVVLGVHQMHLKGVAHRDLKSSNCLLMVSGSITEARVGDLGRAKDLTVPARFAPSDYFNGRGDLTFAPPEYLLSQGGNTVADCKNADLYGLGSLLFELGTGHPITGAALGSVRAVMTQGQLDLRAGVSRDLATLRPKYRAAIEEFTDQLPPNLRHPATDLVTQLCDPVPGERQPRGAPGKRFAPADELHWLIRRADILSRSLKCDEPRRRFHFPKQSRRSA